MLYDIDSQECDRYWSRWWLYPSVCTSASFSKAKKKKKSADMKLAVQISQTVEQPLRIVSNYKV